MVARLPLRRQARVRFPTHDLEVIMFEIYDIHGKKVLVTKETVSFNLKELGVDYRIYSRPEKGKLIMRGKNLNELKESYDRFRI